jgi:hypothetical protein
MPRYSLDKHTRNHTAASTMINIASCCAVFPFLAVSVQPRRYINVHTSMPTCFCVTGHHQVYKVLSWRNSLLCYHAVLLLFFGVNASEYSRLYWVIMSLLCTCLGLCFCWFVLSFCVCRWFQCFCKSGSLDRDGRSVYVFSLNNFWTPEPIFIKPGMYICPCVHLNGLLHNSLPSFK